MKICTILLYVIAGFCDAQTPASYHGASDASAAVAVGDDKFIVADDENNILLLYKIGNTGNPVDSFELSEYLGTTSDHPEADIEGATLAGNRIYWITSHGRNKDGKLRPNRYRFFATDIDVSGNTVKLKPVGTPYQKLVSDLVSNRLMRDLGIDKASRLDTKDLKKKDRKKLAPKQEGLNIEALAASADGKTLYIGFRNPRPKTLLSRHGRAIVVPLLNADEILENSAAPQFAKPLLWDLKGLGIRSMEYSSFHKAFFIVAGSHAEGGSFMLYRWSGTSNEPPFAVKVIAHENFNPEALIPAKNSPKLLLLSDDGSLEVTITDPSQCIEGELIDTNKCKNKHLVDPKIKTFRAMYITCKP